MENREWMLVRADSTTARFAILLVCAGTMANDARADSNAFSAITTIDRANATKTCVHATQTTLVVSGRVNITKNTASTGGANVD